MDTAELRMAWGPRVAPGTRVTEAPGGALDHLGGGVGSKGQWPQGSRMTPDPQVGTLGSKRTTDPRGHHVPRGETSDFGDSSFSPVKRTENYQELERTGKQSAHPSIAKAKRRQGDERQISVHIKNFIRPQREKEMLFPLQNLTSSPRYPPLPGCSTALTLPPCSPSLVTLSTLPNFPL